MVIRRTLFRFAGIASLVATLSCSVPAPAEVAPTPNIRATVEARVQAQSEAAAAIEATVEARVQAQSEAAAVIEATAVHLEAFNPPVTTPATVPVQVLIEAPSATTTPVPPRTAQVQNTITIGPYEAIQRSVVKITVNTPHGIGQGSGVIIGQGNHVITNAHVIDEAFSSIEVSFHPESGPSKVANGQMVFSDRDMDLALIRLDSRLGEPIEVARGLPVLGDTLVLGGFPAIGGETLTATKGTVAGFDYNGAVIKFDGQIGRGSSGGAAVNEWGKLIGIASWSSGDPSGGSLGMLLAIPSIGYILARELVEGSRIQDMEIGARYSLTIVGIPAVAIVPEGWKSVVNFGYFDMRAPGTGTDRLGEDYHVIGIFTRDLVTDESPQDILEKIVAQSQGSYQVVSNNKIEPPDGFSDCLLVYNDKLFEMSGFEARGSVIGTGWISVAGLHTRFCVGQTTEGTVIGFVESPSLEISKEDHQWLSSSISVLSN